MPHSKRTKAGLSVIPKRGTVTALPRFRPQVTTESQRRLPGSTALWQSKQEVPRPVKVRREPSEPILSSSRFLRHVTCLVFINTLVRITSTEQVAASSELGPQVLGAGRSSHQGKELTEVRRSKQVIN